LSKGLALGEPTKELALWKPSIEPGAFGIWMNNKGFQRPAAFDGSRAAPWRVQGRSPWWLVYAGVKADRAKPRAIILVGRVMHFG
jgi:hypothetical protein